MRGFLTFVVGGFFGSAVGFAIGIFVYPYIFLADVVASEEVVGAETKQIIAAGAFIHVNPSDPIHYGSGAVTVYDDTVRLEQDFEVGPGPKYHVYLVPSDDVTSSSVVQTACSSILGA